MISARESHYDVLGLAQGASSEEISRAFIREIGRPRAFGGIAEVSIAYETLRDPARRRAYDASLGLGPKPDPTPEPRWRTYAVHASAHPAERPTSETLERPKPAVKAPPEPRAEPRPFLAARLRELAAAEPLAPPEREEKAVADDLARPPAVVERPPAEAEPVAMQWKRIGIPAAGLILCIGLLGAWAGWQRGTVPARPESAAMLAPPPTTFTVAGDPPAAAAAAVFDEVPALARKRTVQAARRTDRHKPAASRLADLERQLDAGPTGPAAPIVAEQSASPGAAAVVPAALPLPNAVIAHTLGRIGYPCGQVASASAAEGSPGVFTVTCSSGHSYRASPVRGRYHFRRLSSR